uniref:Protein kinase domain-containing protein n=1 Tax=Timema cristinae TaxID=61476 RepID=A0A7R9H8B5_TIMCR|nr:unnamed protein product [Timema cristinae]
MGKTSITKRAPPSSDKDVPHNMGKKDVIRASDFNFLMVLGKGSFGKVSHLVIFYTPDTSWVRLQLPHGAGQGELWQGSSSCDILYSGYLLGVLSSWSLAPPNCRELLVMLAERKGTDELYAIKILKKDIIIQDDDVECTMVEKRVLALSSKPPFLVQLHSCFQTMDRLYFVMEYVNGGDLMFQIQQCGKFKEPVAVESMEGEDSSDLDSDITTTNPSATSYTDVSNNDPRPTHNPYKEERDPQKKKSRTTETTPDECLDGKQHFMGKKEKGSIILYQPYGKSVDWWAYGVLLYEMLVGQPPFDGEDEEELFAAITDHNVSYPKSLSKEAKECCKGFLTKNPTKRLGCGNRGEEDKTDLTPTDKLFMMNLDQTEFMGFSFLNPEFAKSPLHDTRRFRIVLTLPRQKVILDRDQLNLKVLSFSLTSLVRTCYTSHWPR